MMPIRAFYSAMFLTLVALSTGITVNRAASQELTSRNELPIEPGSEPRQLSSPLANQLQSNTPSAAAKLTAANVWPPEAIARPNPLWAIPVASLAATRERPIFSPSRRPPPPAAPPVPQAQQSLQGNDPDHPLLILLGTVAEAQDGIAILENEKSKDIVRLRTGESQAGWTLTAVTPREVTFMHDQKTAILDIPSPSAK
jgi:hypothetical protein